MLFLHKLQKFEIVRAAISMVINVKSSDFYSSTAIVFLRTNACMRFSCQGSSKPMNMRMHSDAHALYTDTAVALLPTQKRCIKGSGAFYLIKCTAERLQKATSCNHCAAPQLN